MFLSMLNKEQKSLFLSLAYHQCMSDNDFSVYEQATMDSYAKEMDMVFDVQSIESNMDKAVAELNAICGAREKRIIVFELVGIAMCDENYDEKERAIIKDVQKAFGLDSSFGDACERKIGDYLGFQKSLTEMVLG